VVNNATWHALTGDKTKQVKNNNPLSWW